VSLTAGSLETSRVSANYPRARADTEERAEARVGLPVETAGGNPGQSDGESPAALEARQEGPCMPQTDTITSGAGKGVWRLAEWRMRSPSGEAWDNIPPVERGPQGAGDRVYGQGLVP
jgi:hypothetical protein